MLPRARALVILAALVGCAESKAPDQNPQQEPANLVDPVPTPIGNAAAVAAGSWSEGRVDGRRAILFVPPSGDPAFAMWCDGRDGLVLERRGIVLTGDVEMMDVSFDDVRGSYAVNPISDRSAARAAVPFNDDILTELRDLEGSLAVSVRDSPLIMPASPLIRELVVACEAA